MTSGTAVKYKGSIDCAVQIMKNEGFMSMMKGAGANILRGVAGPGVLVKSGSGGEFKRAFNKSAVALLTFIQFYSTPSAGSPSTKVPPQRSMQDAFPLLY